MLYAVSTRSPGVEKEGDLMEQAFDGTLSQLQARGQLSAVHLMVAAGTTREQWRQLVRATARTVRGSEWWIADLAFYAQHQLEDGTAALIEMAELTGISAGRLRMLAFAAQKYPRSQRKEGVSVWTHLDLATMRPKKRAAALVETKERGLSRPAARARAGRPPRSLTQAITVRLSRKAWRKSRCREELLAWCNKYHARMSVYGEATPAAA